MFTTFCVVLLPALVVTGLRIDGYVTSAPAALAIGAVLSLAVATAGSKLWAAGPHDIVFSDLMLWGFLRRMRTERRLAQAAGMLGLTGERITLPDHVPPEQAVQALESFAASLEARDSYTHGHTQRVARHSHMIAKAMGLSDEQVAKVRTAAAVHDVGKISTPREIMNKPGKLTEDEYAVMKRHAVVGAAMVGRIDDPEITAMVRHHHEQLDGSGYPDGLSGGDIPLGARIIAVADTFDAITSARPYRPAQKHGRAMRILRAEAGTQLDPRAVEAFLDYYSGRGSVARWSMLAAVPQKLGAMLGTLLHATGAASISQGVAAFGAAAAIAAGANGAAMKHERSAHHSHKPSGSAAGAAALSSYSVPQTGGSVVVIDAFPAEVTDPAKRQVPRPHDKQGHGSAPPAGAPLPLRDHPPSAGANPVPTAKDQKKDRSDDAAGAPSVPASEDTKKEDGPPKGGGDLPSGGEKQAPGQSKPKKKVPPPQPPPSPAPEPGSGKDPKPKK